jgi:dihydrofolate reductase (trimethoprim resistance protein)
MTDHVLPQWPLGTRVRKISGSAWRGRVVGYYSTALTPDGYCVESDYEPGSVQIYPRRALERWAGKSL